LTPELLTEFYLGRAQLAKRLSHKDLQILLDSYPSAPFQKALLPLYSVLSRKTVRLETQMRAEIGPHRLPGEVLNVSREGLLLRMKKGGLTVGQRCEIRVWLNDSLSTRLLVEARWCPDSKLIGAHILETSAEWQQMIDTLEREHRVFTPKLKLAA
jgi:hypothetical protein